MIPADIPNPLPSPVCPVVVRAVAGLMLPELLAYRPTDCDALTDAALVARCAQAGASIPETAAERCICGPLRRAGEFTLAERARVLLLTGAVRVVQDEWCVRREWRA